VDQSYYVMWWCQLLTGDTLLTGGSALARALGLSGDQQS
jgi:hypothetical protein